jgi:hypothetical protein
MREVEALTRVFLLLKKGKRKDKYKHKYTGGTL